MTLGELIKSHVWLSVKFTMEKLFPAELDQMDAYEDVFNELNDLQPKESDITIKVEWVYDRFDNDEYVDVSGYYTDPSKITDGYSSYLAIEFTPWEEWLSMPIDKESFIEFNELEIIGYCLYEMTFVAFDQEDIQLEIQGWEGQIEEYMNMTPEDKAQKSRDAKDFEKFLGIEDDDEEDEDDSEDEEE